MASNISDKLLGVIFCLLGLFFIFDRRVEKIAFLYLFDGSWNESPRWRMSKRIILGIICLLAGLLALLHGAKPGHLVY